MVHSIEHREICQAEAFDFGPRLRLPDVGVLPTVDCYTPMAITLPSVPGTHQSSDSYQMHCRFMGSARPSSSMCMRVVTKQKDSRLGIGNLTDPVLAGTDIGRDYHYLPKRKFVHSEMREHPRAQETDSSYVRSPRYKMKDLSSTRYEQKHYFDIHPS